MAQLSLTLLLACYTVISNSSAYLKPGHLRSMFIRVSNKRPGLERLKVHYNIVSA